MEHWNITIPSRPCPLLPPVQNDRYAVIEARQLKIAEFLS